MSLSPPIPFSPPSTSESPQTANVASSQLHPQTSKRKRAEGGDGEGVARKSLKRKKSKKAKQTDDENLDLHLGLNLAIGKLNSPLLADYVAQRTKRFSPNLSFVELEDLHITEKAFHDTSEWDQTRNLQNLPSFLDRYSLKAGTGKTLSTASKQTGAPHTLVVTSAGLRAADITRALRTFQTKDSIVAKLFAKHIKLKDAIAYVKQTRMGIGVGTPSRIIDLLNAETLLSSKIERVVVDCSHIDQKKRGIFDMLETQQPLMQLLNRPELKDRYGNDVGSIQLIMY